ncbi:MAG: DUF1080 domain-containing protein [Pirellulales bacterium]
MIHHFCSIRRASYFFLLAFLSVVSMPPLACAAPATEPPTDIDLATRIQGEYQGAVRVDGERQRWGVQVIALGHGKFHAVGYPGGLPGDGWIGDGKREVDGTAHGQSATFSGDEFSLVVHDGQLAIRTDEGQELGVLKKVTRKSPTLGATPPKHAVVLMDGSSADAFEGGRLTPDGLLMQGATSKQKFGSFHLHLEFRLPLMPEARNQDRGNSGCYCQGRYEVQVLDSFGLEGRDNECGGIYGVAPPRINMCYPPLSWQTYAIDFTAPVYEDGRKVKNASITVRHNGVEVQRDQEISRATRAAPLPEGPGPGPIFLQDHGSPVRYRNIWVVEP